MCNCAGTRRIDSTRAWTDQEETEEYAIVPAHDANWQSRLISESPASAKPFWVPSSRTLDRRAR
jgi:hypothetical protein